MLRDATQWVLWVLYGQQQRRGYSGYSAGSSNAGGTLGTLWALSSNAGGALGTLWAPTTQGVLWVLCGLQQRRGTLGTLWALSSNAGVLHELRDPPQVAETSSEELLRHVPAVGRTSYATLHVARCNGVLFGRARVAQTNKQAPRSAAEYALPCTRSVSACSCRACYPRTYRHASRGIVDGSPATVCSSARTARLRCNAMQRDATRCNGNDATTQQCSNPTLIWRYLAVLSQA